MRKAAWILAGCVLAAALSGCGNAAPAAGSEQVEEVMSSPVSESDEEVNSQESVEDMTQESLEASSEETAETRQEENAVADLPTGDGHENARDAVDHMVIGWNLGNTFDSTGEWITQYTDGTNDAFETAWGNPVTPETLMPRLKEMGFGAVRVPVTWRYHFDEEGNIDEAWMARIQEVVDWVLDNDMYCIINIHHDTGADGWLRATEANYEENAELYSKLWQQIAERFRDYPDTLLFEGINEILDDNAEWNNPKWESVTAVNQYNQLFVDTVRASGGNNAARNLICNTYAAACSGISLNGFKVPEDSVENHLIAQVHFYTPYAFCASDATWTASLSEYNDTIEKEIDGVFSNLKMKLLEKNIPMIIGEFAADDKENTEDRIKWYVHVIEKAKENDITCFIWDNGGGYCMGLIDRTGSEDPFPEIVEACIEAARGAE